jgi:hypothetical protein
MTSISHGREQGRNVRNEHGQTRRDHVHKALQQAWVVHDRDGTNEWKQKQSVQRAQVV